MNKTILISFLIISINLFSQKLTYFDKDWKETTKEKALYYRSVDLIDNYFLISDYFMDGQIQFKGISSSEKEPLILEGEAIWYNKEGKILQKRNYKSNIPNGKELSYYSNGKIKNQRVYSNGILNGIYTEYFPTGEVANEANFLNNQINGTHIKYRSPNQLEFKVDYKNGVIDGNYEFYNSNGTLLNKGQAKKGIQDGRCYDYYYEGKLRKEYTIKNGKLDGKYIEYSTDGEVTTTGFFEEGKANSFESKSLGTTNNSQFSNAMKVKKGIECWKMFRDEKLILEYYYKRGYKAEKWKVYNFDGSKLYQTIEFDDSTNCKQDYLQTTKDKFDPFFFLDERFLFDSKLIENNDCEKLKIIKYLDDSENPFFYYVKLENTDTSKKELNNKKKDNIIDYKEPAYREDFLLKNNCIALPHYENITVCTKEINSIIHKVFLSENVKALKEYRENAKPKDNEIYFFYQRFEERIYDLDKETPNRYMGFKVPKVLVEAFKDKTLDYISVIGVYEQEFWSIDNFSGSSAYFAFEKEIKKN